ncbi:hypothetical protein [Anaerotignum sp. MB30-C6]|uniref:hypothetical protein n=1 Tax=Anaerotignum sp. MB30-C6 TaxID=3070814 RepID=UPI0027DE7B29|nr:hypothetical protein [Anaerotignum sp. MB30-C6]WMI80094.1 hypothetical protein RBQ60_09625 [Anaerotignum sp. MB30-C6]
MSISCTELPNTLKNHHTGALVVQTFTAKRAHPVPEAEVKISQNTPEGEKVIFKGETDISGKLFSIPLAGVKAVDTLNPKIDFQDLVRRNSYTITVSHPEYLTMIFYNAPVFEGILSIQSVDMVPKILSTSPNKPVEIHQKQQRI